MKQMSEFVAWHISLDAPLQRVSLFVMDGCLNFF